MHPPVRIAVVGAGAIAQLAHLPVLSKLRGAQLVALCDNDRAKARALADRFSIPDVFTDIDDLLDYDELDAVVVASPSHLHEPQVLQLLAAGVDVLCERPLSLASKGIERILAAAARGNRKVFVANNHRFRSDVQALARFLSGGELGKLSGVRAGAYHPRGKIEGWRLRRQEAGGGALFEQGFPLVDLAMWLADFPVPERVWCHIDRARGANAVEESAVLAVECANNISFSIDVSWSYVGTDERWWFETLSSRGSARLAPLRVAKELNGKPVDVSPTGAAARESAFIQSYRAELTHFVSVLRGEVEYEAPTDQVIVHRLLEAAYKSAEERKEVRL
ncbi:MAG: Gfo/Idh/MocA family oxidoreductase [Gemmatimonadetes bacterium]|nr:Gfo/Idh/MocA family oxidoreductase [Gemmatimonadota bacterium]MBK9980144.1 Gfo/Idh/MocA family oxidoreductase [Gemmatimonadota bacterium]